MVDGSYLQEPLGRGSHDDGGLKPKEHSQSQVQLLSSPPLAITYREGNRLQTSLLLEVWLGLEFSTAMASLDRCSTEVVHTGKKRL